MRRQMLLKNVKVYYVMLLVFLSPTIGIAVERVYFGNIHSHCSYSDGVGTPEDAYRYARHTAHLDFLAITDHNHKYAENGAGERRDGLMIATNTSLYTNNTMSEAQQWIEDGEFVALYGQEYSSIGKGNHINVYDVSQVIDVENGEFKKLIDWLKTHKNSSNQFALIQLNHPLSYSTASKEYGADDFGSQAAWIAAMDKQAHLLEILNGPSTTKDSGVEPAEMAQSEYLRYLKLGFHVGPTGNQDNHYSTWGTATDARTGVIASELTKAAIYKALTDRHVYATEDKNLRIIFWVNDHLCGDRITAPAQNTELEIEFTISDDDEPDSVYDIEVYSGVIGGSNAESIDTYTVEGDTQQGEVYTIDEVKYTGGSQYVFFKVTQFGEEGNNDRAWTAPVWLEP